MYADTRQLRVGSGLGGGERAQSAAEVASSEQGQSGTGAERHGHKMALAPAVQRLVDPLLATGRYAIEELEAGDTGQGALLDRFCLVVHYCAGALRWFVVFNAAQPTAPPDVVLGDGDEEWAEAMWMDSAPPLHPAQWCGGADPAVLLTAMEWLVAAYADHNKRLARDSGIERLKWEYTTFLSHTPGVELILRQEVSSTFLDVVAPIELQESTLALTRGPKQAGLAVSAETGPPRLRVLLSYGGGGDMSATLLEIVWPQSPEWRSIASTFTLPAWSGADMCLSTFVGETTASLEEKVVSICRGRQQRRSLVTALVAHFGPLAESDLDDNAVGTATFLVQENDSEGVSVTMALIFNIADGFPEVCPKILLCHVGMCDSGSAAGGGGPVRVVYGATEFPYSPRWDGPEMARRLHAFVRESATAALLAKCAAISS